MGCCVSSDEGGSESRRVGRFDDKAASFTSMEEETVKEVMSETPARPACFVSRDNQRRVVGVHNHFMMKHGQQNVGDEISEVGSLYENVTMVEGRESNEYYRYSQGVLRDRTPVKYPKSKSISGEVGRQSSGRRSPAAKSTDPSPRRRNNVEGSGNLRSVSSRDSPQKAAWGRPDSGERSGRRSRSPGMRSDNRSGGGVGRSPSGRKLQGQSPKGARGRRNEEGGRVGGGEGKWAQAEESLDNPLVALECFIFL